MTSGLLSILPLPAANAPPALQHARGTAHQHALRTCAATTATAHTTVPRACMRGDMCGTLYISSVSFTTHTNFSFTRIHLQHAFPPCHTPRCPCSAPHCRRHAPHSRLPACGTFTRAAVSYDASRGILRYRLHLTLPSHREGVRIDAASGGRTSVTR